jgi:hypothetical protein
MQAAHRPDLESITLTHDTHFRSERSTGVTSGMCRVSLDESERRAGGPERVTVKTAAPIVAERVHDQIEHIDKTRHEELREKTHVVQTVQPIKDERREAAQRERVDHGVEIHEHGRPGIDAGTEAELARKREQIAKERAPSHDVQVTERSERPEVQKMERTTVVEEVSLLYILATHKLQPC